MFDIVELLNRANIRCDVLCSNSEYAYNVERINGYRVIRTKSLGKYFSTSITPQMIWKLNKVVNEYDIIHVHLPDPMASLALFFCDLKNQKIVLHWHSDIVRQKYMLKLYEPLQNWIMSKADCIIATTPKYIEGSKYLQKYKEKCISIPIGIDEQKLHTSSEFVTEIKNKFLGKKIIFSLGRLAYYKGFEYLVKAAKYLPDDYVILIGGKGEMRQELTKIIIGENLFNKVVLLGELSNASLGSYYSACDIFCLPSIMKSEAFGVVQIEAMSFAKPIVATNIIGSGVNWVNEHGVSGINVDIMDPEALANAFVYLCSNEKTYKDYSARALDRYVKYFTREKMINSIIDLYKNLNRVYN